MYRTIEHRFGNVTIPEYIKTFRSHYAVVNDACLWQISEDGQTYLITKDIDNDKGGTEDLGMQSSCAEIGLCQGFRTAPWVFPKQRGQMMGRNAEYTAMRWGRVLTGAKAAWAADVDRTNKTLQDSVNVPITGCTVCHPKTPRQCKQKMKDLHNILNNTALSTTLLERYNNVPTIDAGFDRARRQNQWYPNTIGVGACDRKKLVYANSHYPLQKLTA